MDLQLTYLLASQLRPLLELIRPFSSEPAFNRSGDPSASAVSYIGIYSEIYISIIGSDCPPIARDTPMTSACDGG